MNNEFRAEIPATLRRQDLADRGYCQEGGGFELDLSAFSGFGNNHFRLTDPDDNTLPNGEFSVHYREIVLGEAAAAIGDLSGKKIGLFGNPRFARDTSIGTCMSKIITCLGVATEDVPKTNDATINLWHCHPHIEKPQGYSNTINFDLSDISKSGIDKAHMIAFGRTVCINSSEIEPGGQYVLKSEANAAHDGKVVSGRDLAEINTTGRVVQRLIDNRIDDNDVLDIRAPVIGKTIPHVILKRRPVANRFSNANTSATMTRTENILTDQEQLQILYFCRIIGAQYCELDILRDAASGEIWVVDVNNTPAGPPNGMSQSEQNAATREQTIAFYREFFASAT